MFEVDASRRRAVLMARRRWPKLHALFSAPPRRLPVPRGSLSRTGWPVRVTTTGALALPWSVVAWRRAMENVAGAWWEGGGEGRGEGGGGRAKGRGQRAGGSEGKGRRVKGGGREQLGKIRRCSVLDNAPRGRREGVIEPGWGPRELINAGPAGVRSGIATSGT